MMLICRVVACVTRKECLLWPVHFLGKTRLAFAYFILYSQAKLASYSGYLLTFHLLHSNPLWWKGHLFLVLVLEGLVGLHRTVQLQLLQHQWLGHRLGLLWCWMVCLRNEPRLFCRFDIVPKQYILGSSVDSEGSSISCQGFLPSSR